jgi:hypothetical protein
MQISRPLGAIGALMIAVAACGGDKPVGPQQGQPTTTSLTCDAGGGQTRACTIPLTSVGTFTVTLVNHDCSAGGDVIRITSPRDTVLTDDACSVTPGTQWTFRGPFSSTASLNMSVRSTLVAFPPALRVTGSAPEWQINFEDGADQDLNDVILTVKTSP